MNQAVFTAVAAAFALCVSVVALAGPPMITDDPSTPRAGGWEINLAFTPLVSRTE